MKRTDRAIGVLAGVALGVVIVVAFVFFGSEGTIDAPRIDHGSTTTTTSSRGGPKPRPKPSKPVTRTAPVTIAGGAPPASGPARLHANVGDRVVLRVTSDATVSVQVLGVDQPAMSVPPGKATSIAFKAMKTGNFPLIVVASHIAVAQIRVGGG